MQAVAGGSSALRNRFDMSVKHGGISSFSISGAALTSEVEGDVCIFCGWRMSTVCSSLSLFVLVFS